MKTKWLPIPDYPSYLISESGEIMRARDCHTAAAGYILKQKLRRGYMTVSLSRDAVLKVHSVHRLVCRAFHGPKPTPNHIVAHGDGNKFNNHRSNLRWATVQENSDDRTKHGTRNYGEKSHFHKLTDAAVMDIRQRHGGGMSISKLSDIYGVSRGQISNIVSNQQQMGQLLHLVQKNA